LKTILIVSFSNQKTPVSVEQASWNVNWPDYKPKEYTADKILKRPSWADNPDV